MKPSARGTRILAAALATAGFALLAGCGDLLGGPRAGTTIETTNGLTARVVLPTGSPATRIKVYLIDEQDWLAKTKADQSIYIDDAETDDEGTFKFKNFDSTRTSCLYADVEGYGFLIHAVTRKMLRDEFKNQIGMSRKVSYQGNIRDDVNKPQRIFLAGSPFSAAVDSTGKFVLNNVPPQKYSVVILRKRPDATLEYVVADNVKLDQAQEGRPDTLVTEPQKSILLENFEDQDIFSHISSILPEGMWVDNTDREYGGRSILTQPANLAPSNWIQALEQGEANNQALHVEYTLGQAPTMPLYKDSRPGTDDAFVSMSLNIGHQGTHYNLGGMDSLTFRAAGNGQLVVDLVQQNPGDVALQVVASKTFDLGTWSSFHLLPNDSDLTVHIGWFPSDPKSFKDEFEKAGLPAYEAAPTKWSEMGGMITYIRFRGTRGDNFWLDDIRIHGISVDSLTSR
jgi:hypothetical protein